MKKFIYIFIFFSFISTSFSQLPGSGISLESSVLDGVYIQEHIPTKRVVSYVHLREADVMWSKRIWRTIDLREKMNHKLYYPLEPQNDRISLFDVIKYGAYQGSLTLYDLGGIEQDDKFRFPVKPENGNIEDPAFKDKLANLFGRENTRDSLAIDEDGNEEPVFDVSGNIIQVKVIEDFVAEKIVRYDLKEDWFFDKQRSMLDVRIIGISPVVLGLFEGKVTGYENLFWLYFPECRYVFQNFFVYNDANDAQRMSFDDLFWKRQFSSFVKKESNVYDRAVSPNWDGLDALLQSEKIRNEIFTFEHDLWHF